MLKTWKYALFGLMAVALAAALVACGGDDDDSADDGDDRSAATERTGDDGKASDDGKTATAKKTASGGDSSEGLALLREASKNLDETTYKLVYELKGDDADMGAVDGVLTIAAAPPKQMFGISGSLGGEDGTFVVINDGTNAFLCVKTADEESCLKTKSSQSTAIPLPSVMDIDEALDEIASAPDTTVKEVDGQTIAGRDGRCFEVKSGEGNGQVCVDEDDGIVLLVNGDFSGSKGTLRLREYTENPPASDFEPPYEVTQFP